MHFSKLLSVIFYTQKYKIYHCQQQIDIYNQKQTAMTFRSIQMSHQQLIIPRESAYMAMDMLGQQNILHIVPHRNVGDRPFHQMVKRCDQSLHKIELLKQSLKQVGTDFEQYDETQALFMQRLHQIWKQQSKTLGVDLSKLFDVYENQINQQFEQYTSLTNRLDKMKQQRQQVLQNLACIEVIQQFFGGGAAKRQSVQYYVNNVANADAMQGISYIVGVIQPQSQMRLSKMIYRVSRGYACTKTLSQFKYSGLRTFQSKVMMVIYPTSDSLTLQKKLKKVIETFSQRYYVMNQLQQSSIHNMQTLKQQYNEVQNLWQMTSKQFISFTQKIKDLSFIQKWRIYLWKQKSLYESIGKLQMRQQFYVGNIYLPSHRIGQMCLKLSRIVPTPTIHQLPLGNPPTAFNSNSYTLSSQEIVNTYGVPRYQQINPTIFTTVTFPFFFGVMFGDIGHGLLILSLGIYLIARNESIKKSSMSFVCDLRYMITMMGFFAVYCGFIYNDLIGFNLNLFSSCYNPPQHPTSDDVKIGQPQFPKPNCVYPFGLDPIWGRAQNQLNYVNGLKMKLSVIIAIIHMTLGICLKASNALFFRKKLDFYLQFIPQIIFMVGLFGYMDFLIIFKWLQPWDERVGDIPPQQWAPSIITTMMNIGLKLGQTGILPNGSSNMWGERGNTSQDMLQIILLAVAFVCIPWMLLPKPIIQIKHAKKHKHLQPLHSQQQFKAEDNLKQNLNYIQSESDAQEQVQHDASQIFVHQLIETIQFVLGAVSNTASYLRLWALSLAHGQLAKVFYDYTVGTFIGVEYFQYASMFVGFWLLSWISFGIIICMDSMECFLHSLRLHWVEFQNKFYKGDGYQYQAFYFKKEILAQKQTNVL